MEKIRAYSSLRDKIEKVNGFLTLSMVCKLNLAKCDKGGRKKIRHAPTSFLQ